MRVWTATVLTALMLASASSSAQTRADWERARIQNQLGWEFMRAERWGEAALAFQRAIEIAPKYEYAHYGLGRALLAQKKYLDAIGVLETCRDLYGATAGRQFSSAQEAQQFRRDRLLELDEQIRLMQTGRQTAQSQDTVRQLQNARQMLQENIQRGSSMSIEGTVPPWVLLSLGSAYFRAGRLPDAERAYKATIAADPKSGEAHNNLAVVFLETGRYAEAEASIRDARRAGFRVQPELEREIRRRKGTDR
ncbi:MAG: tetratricopeptide repeat protein [Acidobacteriota bacterium]